MITEQEHYQLRKYRKSSALSQNDLAFLFGLSGFAPISRWEQGSRKPDLEHMLYYHLLFNVPVEVFLEKQFKDSKKRLCVRINLLLETMNAEYSSRKMDHRLNFLKETLTRLNEAHSPSI
jgi:transcriptional regulator with XRE-family HTH domain